MQRGSLRTLRDAGEVDEGSDGLSSTFAPPTQEGAVELDGFNLHASVAIAADDDLGRCPDRARWRPSAGWLESGDRQTGWSDRLARK